MKLTVTAESIEWTDTVWQSNSDFKRDKFWTFHHSLKFTALNIQILKQISG